MLLRRVICGRLMLNITGLLYLRFVSMIAYFANVDFIVLNVSRYVIRSLSNYVLRAYLTFRLVNTGGTECDN